MNTDEDNSESTKDWLAQELIPAMSTVSGEEHRTVSELFVKFRWILLLCIITMCVAIFAYCSLLSNPPYTVEMRDKNSNGTVTFQAHRYEDSDHSATIAALRQRTFARIYHSVYYNGLEFCFSKSGHVYATEGTEVGGPCYFVHSWDWSGDPHEFPYYNFSHTWRKGEP